MRHKHLMSEVIHALAQAQLLLNVWFEKLPPPFARGMGDRLNHLERSLLRIQEMLAKRGNAPRNA